MKVAFYTLGCKVNQYETQVLSEAFANNGFTVVSCQQPADVYVVNSCTVTATSDKKTRQTVRRLKRLQPEAKIVLTGCLVQANPSIFESLPEIDLAYGVRDRLELINAVKHLLADRQRRAMIHTHEPKEPFEPMQISEFEEHTRAYIKIEDGCDRYCTYCIIPTARGPVRSKPLADIRAEVQKLAANGYLEIVLVGINLSSYGKGSDKRLIDAIETACAVSEKVRIRLGSLECDLLTEEDIIRMAALKNFCPQFHLSLQSGSDTVLQRMNRRYDTAAYAQVVAYIRKYFENPSITTDIMVGFPGETEAEFLQSVAFAQTIGFAKTHVFSYSRRKGTKADAMPNQIDPQIKEERSNRMIAATLTTEQQFLENQVGTIQEVLVETLCEKDTYDGYTKNYTPVKIHSKKEIRSTIQQIKITKADKTFCWGELR